jgi:hypothetical protein
MTPVEGGAVGFELKVERMKRREDVDAFVEDRLCARFGSSVRE